MERARVVAVVVAAGSGTRLGGDVPKALRTIGGRPVVAVAVDRALASPTIDAVVVVAPPGSEDALRGMFAEVSGSVIVVTGGSTRQRSVAAGLDAVGDHVEVVAVHDAARPFASPGALHVGRPGRTGGRRRRRAGRVARRHGEARAGRVDRRDRAAGRPGARTDAASVPSRPAPRRDRESEKRRAWTSPTTRG